MCMTKHQMCVTKHQICVIKHQIVWQNTRYVWQNTKLLQLQTLKCPICGHRLLQTISKAADVWPNVTQKRCGCDKIQQRKYCTLQKDLPVKETATEFYYDTVATIGLKVSRADSSLSSFWRLRQWEAQKYNVGDKSLGGGQTLQEFVAKRVLVTKVILNQAQEYPQGEGGRGGGYLCNVTTNNQMTHSCCCLPHLRWRRK